MAHDVAQFEWSRARTRAAALLAAGDLTDEEIARRCKVSRRSLARWKLVPEFAERVAQDRRALREAILKEGIADKQARMLALNTTMERLQQVMKERAVDPLVKDVPGGETGLIVPEPMFVKVYRGDGNGQEGADPEGQQMTVIPKEARLVYKYSVDVAVLKELRETLKQAAIETGEWTEKQEHSGELLLRKYVGVDPNEV